MAVDRFLNTITKVPLIKTHTVPLFLALTRALTSCVKNAPTPTPTPTPTPSPTPSPTPTPTPIPTPTPDTTNPGVSYTPLSPVTPETLVDIIAMATDNVDVATVNLYDKPTGALLQTKNVDGVKTSADVTFNGVASPFRRGLDKGYQLEAVDAAGCGTN